ncbi:Hypothetical predicted protein [Podarcis lilfordi]|uniref:Uncharacterized protein n=1 Tax=Podarcis lilfordi TaxID=74358 RepID=A0AA35PD37_9SAUR|nr:Hypothetical predicted protein [Podarcis lilfordi]
MGKIHIEPPTFDLVGSCYGSNCYSVVIVSQNNARKYGITIDHTGLEFQGMIQEAQYDSTA